MASTVIRIATPGMMLIQGASRSIVRDAPIMNPQLIILRSPRPRKASDDSVRMAVAIISDAVTMMGEIALGKIWVKMIRDGRCPMTTAACTNSRCLSVRNSPRTRRATGGQETTAMAPTIE